MDDQDQEPRFKIVVKVKELVQITLRIARPSYKIKFHHAKVEKLKAFLNSHI